MFIFYSFQVPVFCGVIWILTNSFMCKESVREGESGSGCSRRNKRVASHCTKTKHQVWSYSIYFYNVLRLAVEMKKSREVQNHIAIFLLARWGWTLNRCVQSPLVCQWDRKRNPSWYHSRVIKANGMCLHWSLIFLCGVCDFIKLAYFTQCLQRCMLW